MKRIIAGSAIITVVFAAVMLIPITKYFIGQVRDSRTYVTTRGSRYCYIRQERNGNIKPKNIVFFKTLEQCGKPLHHKVSKAQ